MRTQLIGIPLAAVSLLLIAAQQLSTRDIASSVSKATVSIMSATPSGVVSGSGFITDPSGTIVTNYHVVDAATRIEVRLSTGETYDVSGVRAVDRRRDIAVLQIPGFQLPAVKLGDSDALTTGDSIVVIGNALGVLENSVTTGLVSGIREYEGTKVVQMSAAASPGNSGGPVVNDRGEVVAITRFKFVAGENLNFAVPINFARGYLEQPAQTGLAMIRATEGGSLFASSSNAFPKRWHSLTSGTDRLITISDDILLVEAVLPDKAKEAGGRGWGDFKKDGDTWKGTWREVVPCTYSQAFKMYLTPKACTFEFPETLTLLSKLKIEGTGLIPPFGAKFSCRTVSA